MLRSSCTNALCDYLAAEYAGAREPVRIWLGAGTTLAQPETPPGIEICVARGSVDAVTRTILPPQGAPCGLTM